ncbi:hypothetical protein TSOC_006516 [Tetrabaena socialis]|uniref:Uncharacterized protein n=1 Tax=Tetrabaena socialis TaxID=47790 RepID=A0A2J8A3H6_9CHLO|nr:hypothetical protein TSOC_006516 [Tetrabaena socialis]|eukprot:PNH07064.1 hypothetical protein TSOC_006516 [Tetrabaena socialis]
MLRKGAQVVLQADRAGQQQTCAAAQAAFTRQFGAPASHGDSPTTPLSPIMPKVVAVPRQVISLALSLTGKAIAGAATSSTVKDLVSSFADKALVSEAIVKVEEVDVAFWAYWLSVAGYSNPAGYKKFAEAAKVKVASLAPQQVTDLVVAFHTTIYSGEEAKEVEKFQTIVEDSVGGELKVFKAGDDVDSVHWYGHHTPAPTSYELYVFRSALVPKEYSPAGMRSAK